MNKSAKDIAVNNLANKTTQLSCKDRRKTRKWLIKEQTVNHNLTIEH